VLKALPPLVILVFWGLTLIGCTSLKLQRKGQEETLLPAVLERAQTSSAKADTLQRLLIAELAGQKGDYALALENYLKVAAEVSEPWVAERATQIALYLNDAEKARAALRLWLERDPQALGAHKVALLLALQARDKEAAVAHFSKVLELVKDNAAEVLLDILRFMDQNMSKEAALEIIEAVSRNFPRSPEISYAYAMLALRAGDPKLALEQISRAVALRPDWPKLKLLQGQLLASLGEDRKARQILKELVKKHPQDVQIRLLYVQLLLRQEAFAQALSELERILKQAPNHPDALYAYALVNLQQGREEKAESALRRLLKQAKWRGEAYFYLGRIALRKGQLAKALEWFDKVEEGKDLVFDAQVQAVTVLTKLRRVQEALERLERLRERFADRKLPLYLLEAELQTNLKDYEAAFTLLTQALQEFPEHPDLLYARALVAEQMGKVSVAIDDLKAAVAKRPEDANLLNALGYTLLEHTDQIQKAQEYLDKAIQLQPEDPAILDSYGWLWYKLGDHARALKYLQQAYARNPDPEIAFHLGEVLWALGRKQEAVKLWRNILRQPQQDERVQSLIERIRDRIGP
jgi:tetratricopeptide (TPR) repeat protein